MLQLSLTNQQMILEPVSLADQRVISLKTSSESSLGTLLAIGTAPALTFWVENCSPVIRKIGRLIAAGAYEQVQFSMDPLAIAAV